MPWRTWKRLVQKKKKKGKKCFLPTENAWLLLTSSKACDWSGHILGASASPINRSFLTKKTGCHPLALFMAVSMIPNMWHSSCYCMRHSWLTKFGVIYLNQLVNTSQVRQQDTRYNQTRDTNACGVRVIFLKHGGALLAVFKSPVCTYNQSWTSVSFTYCFKFQRPLFRDWYRDWDIQQIWMTDICSK